MQFMKTVKPVFLADHPDLGPVFEVRCPYCRDIVQIAPLGPNSKGDPCQCGEWVLEMRAMFRNKPKADKGYKGRMRG